MVWHSYISRSAIEVTESSNPLLSAICVGISELLGVEKLKSEEAEFAKTLYVEPLETIAFKRFWLSSGYKYPVTIQLFGYNGDIVGMNVKIYDPQSPQNDTNGLYLVLLNRLQSGETVNLKRRISYKVDEYRQIYGIVDLLVIRGFDILFNRAMSWTGKGAPSVHRVVLHQDFKPQICCMESFYVISESQS